jgi:hypothetical protein
MKSLGLNEEQVQEFLANTYRQSMEQGIQPETIAGNLKQLLNLFGSIPLSEVPIHLMNKAQEKADLEREIERLRVQQLQANKSTEDALNRQMVTVNELHSYLNFKKEIANNDISTDDIPKFIKMLDIITTGLHPGEVVSKFQDLEEIRGRKILRDQLRSEINQLNDEISHLKQEREAHMQVFKTYKTLESLGFGLKELKNLLNTIKEIAEANGIPPDFAIIKFFSEIEDDYDKILGFKSKLDTLKSEIKNEQFKREAIQSHLYGIDWASLIRLMQWGQVPQGQNSGTSQEKHEAKTDKVP